MRTAATSQRIPSVDIMQNTRLKSRVTDHASERELLLACRQGCVEAVEPLVELHALAALDLAGRLGADMPPDDLVDLVHDAFVIAFDEAIESEADSLTMVLHGLVRLLVERGSASPHRAVTESTIPVNTLRALQTELVQELRVMIAIHTEAPHVLTPVRRLLAELRALRRRLQLSSQLLLEVADHHDSSPREPR